MKITRFMGKREWLLTVVAVAAIVAQVWLDLRLPDYMQEVTKVIVSPGAEMSQVLDEGLLMLLCAFGSMLAAVVTGFCVAWIASTIAKRMRAAVFHKTMDFSSAELDNFGTSSLITRSTNDVTQIQLFVTIGMQILVKSPILAVWAILKMAGKNVTWTLATAVTVVIMMTIMAILIRLVMPRMMRMQRITDDLNRVSREHLGGLRVIRAYRAQLFHSKRFEETNTELTNNNLFVMRAMSGLMPMMTAIMSGLSLAIYGFGASMINASDQPQDRVRLFSEMIVFSSYAAQVIGAFMMMAMAFVLMPRAIVSYRRLSEVIRTKPSVRSGAVTKGSESGTVRFNHVSFRYPDADDDALHDIDFHIERGQTAAFIGATGSGKSTIINLIPRFFDATKGSVVVDGVDVKDWDLQALRRRIGYASQKATLFSGTIAQNIGYGDGPIELDAETVVEAAKTAHAADFIAQKEDAYAGHVAQGGSNFSGGQKQRISIARTVGRGADILIFDDTFSALDYRTDKNVRTSIEGATPESTVILVSQRIGTVRGADQIFVVDHGRIVGTGTHDQLMETSDVYREIALSQLSAQELA